MNVRCVNDECGQHFIVKLCEVALRPNELVHCGECLQPVEETAEPLTPITVVLPDGSSVDYLPGQEETLWAALAASGG